MICNYCNKEALFCENKEIYGKNYGKSYMCYYCKDCDSYMGVHENDPNRPLGTLANKELRELRKKAHSLLDPLRQVGGYRRKAIYNKLSEYFGKEVHIGESDINMCNLIIKFLESGKIY